MMTMITMSTDIHRSHRYLAHLHHHHHHQLRTLTWLLGGGRDGMATVDPRGDGAMSARASRQTASVNFFPNT